MSERLVSPLVENDGDADLSLRPQLLNEYVGQSKAKENLQVFIQASRSRQEALDHILLYGPPGLGKTTLAHVIANELKANIRVVSGPAIERTGDLAAILSTLSEGDVLFIDEIHRLPRIVEEMLYSAMEDYTISVVIGKDTAARSLTIDLPPFTLVGATTRAGDLSAPLRDRFGIVNKLEYYSQDEIEAILDRTSKVYKTTITRDAITEVGRRSRGTPRVANRLFRRIRDFATVKNEGIIDAKLAKYALEALHVDSLGLDRIDIMYLEGIIHRFNGGPVGLEAIASAIGEETMTLEDVCEPYLLQIGMINRTPRGRQVTEKAYQHLKVAYQERLL